MPDTAWTGLWLSLRIATFATLLAFVVAVPLAAITSRRRFFGRSLVDASLLLPLVLPPTVVGYLLLVAFGRYGPVGSLIERVTGASIIFSITGAILAAAIVAFPLIYLPAKSGMAAVAQEMLDAAKIEGATRVQTFARVLVPMSIKHLAAGGVLAFARAMGEFGATMMVLGWRPGKTTLPIQVYAAYIEARMGEAWMPVALLTGASVVIVVAYHRLLRED
jgi:molybdate transport system permease protein